MASITSYMTKNGRMFRANIRRHNLSQSRSFKTRKEAKQWAESIENTLASTPTPPQTQHSHSYTLTDLIEYYRLNVMPTKEKSTQKAQHACLHFWQVNLGDTRLSALSTADILRCRDTLLVDHTPGTTRQYLVILKAMLRVSIDDLGWLQRNPMKRVVLPLESPPRMNYLSKEQIHHLLNICRNSSNHQLYPIMYLALHSALRASEILNIRIKDFNMEELSIHIPKTKNKREHTIYITQETVQVLVYHIFCTYDTQPHNWRYFTVKNDHLIFDDNAYLFPSITLDKPVNIMYAWKKARKEAGIEDIVFHSTRTTVLTHLANAGLSDFQLAQIANHKDFRSTRKYTKGDPDKIRENFQLIGTLLK